MLQLFRSNQVLLSVLLIVYAALLHISWWFVEPVALPADGGVAMVYIDQWLSGMPSWVGLMAAILCLAFQGGIANHLVMEHRLARQVNLFPGAFLVLVSSLLPAFMPFSSYHLANVFALLALSNLVRAYRVASAADIIFNTGFWIGMASLFQPQYLLFLLAGWMGMTVLRARKLPELLTLLLGAFVPWLLMGFGFFWYDQFEIFWGHQWINSFSLPYILQEGGLPIVETVTMGALVLFVLFSYRNYQLKTTVDVQKKQDLIYWFLLASVLTAIFAQPWHLVRWLAAAPYIGILIAFSFTNTSSRSAEAWHLFLLLLLAGLHSYKMLIV